jgi:hypothetical protein
MHFLCGYNHSGKEVRKMDIFIDRINNIKASILKFVPAKYIYLFGSYAQSAEKHLKAYLAYQDIIPEKLII